MSPTLTLSKWRIGLRRVRFIRMTLWVCIFCAPGCGIDGKKHNIWTNESEDVKWHQNLQQVLATGAATWAFYGWRPARWWGRRNRRQRGRGAAAGRLVSCKEAPRATLHCADCTLGMQEWRKQKWNNKVQHKIGMKQYDKQKTGYTQKKIMWAAKGNKTVQMLHLSPINISPQNSKTNKREIIKHFMFCLVMDVTNRHNTHLPIFKENLSSRKTENSEYGTIIYVFTCNATFGPCAKALRNSLYYFTDLRSAAHRNVPGQYPSIEWLTMTLPVFLSPGYWYIGRASRDHP